MDEKILFTQLTELLDRLLKHHRVLCELLVSEREELIENDLEAIDRLVVSKTKILEKIQVIEKQRIEVSQNLGHTLGILKPSVRLLEIADRCEKKDGEILRTYHEILQKILLQVKEENVKNEFLIQSALKTFRGSIKSLESEFGQFTDEKKTYQRNGEKESVRHSQGFFVRKEI